MLKPRPLWVGVLLCSASSCITAQTDGTPDAIFRTDGSSPRALDVPAVVGELRAGSPADQAGMHVGDRITSIDGQAIDNWSSVVAIVRALQIGQSVVVTVQRGNEVISLPVVIGATETPEGPRPHLGVVVARGDVQR